MRLGSRIEKLEQRFGRPPGVRTIIWSGVDWDGSIRATADRCHREGVRLRVIRVGVMDYARSVEEAHRRIAHHKKAAASAPITVYLQDDAERTVLADYDPGLPDWLVKGNP